MFKDWHPQYLVAVSEVTSFLILNPAIRNPIVISLGAIAGALSRYYLTLWFAQRFGSSFPYSTFFINLSGCFSMGFFMTLALSRVVIVPAEIRLLVATGFLGSYTTFSTYGLDTITLLSNNHFMLGVLYWSGSAILGILSVQLGVVLAHFFIHSN